MQPAETPVTSNPERQIDHRLLVLALVLAAMAYTMPSFMARLAQPFSFARLGMTDAAAAPAVVPEGAQKATFAAGCFWGVEHIFRKHFGDGRGLLDARVGYIGGDTASPSYRAVCSGATGHAEATQLVFDPAKVSYRQLVEFFYRTHDPTTKDRQGNDRGSQYRSAVFFHDADQERVAREVTRQANEQWWNNKIVTEILPAGQWWDAEDYHQLYLDKNPSGYQCENHHVRNFPELK